ncbi:unnamed protein product [Choristocarpus tenellus]
MGKSRSGQWWTLRLLSTPANSAQRAPRCLCQPRWMGRGYKKLIIEDVIPAIKACMLRLEGHTIFVQQDGANATHQGGGIMKAIEEVVGDDTVIETQPVNSPNLNVNDLGFFRFIRQLKEDMR